MWRVASRPSVARARKGLPSWRAEFVQTFGEIGAVPEALAGLGVLALDALVQRFPDDDDPGGQRHDQQDEGDGAGDRVALGPEVGEA